MLIDLVNASLSLSLSIDREHELLTIYKDHHILYFT